MRDLTPLIIVYILLTLSIASKDYNRRMDIKQLRSMIEYYHGEQFTKLDTIIHSQTVERAIREQE